MFHRHVTRDLSAYCQGELSPERARQVALHLEGCASCREEHEEIEAGIYLAEHLPAMFAPADLWKSVERGLEQGRPEPGRPALLSILPGLRPLVATLIVVLSVAALWYYAQPRRSPAFEVDLNAYLHAVETAADSAGETAVASAPNGFADSEVSQALAVAGIGHVASRSPLAGFRLVSHRIRQVGEGSAAQLVYRRDGGAFAVFVARDPVVFSFGRREVRATKINGVSCHEVDCPRTSTLWFEADGFHCVLVSKSREREKLGAMVSYFASAHRTRGGL